MTAQIQSTVKQWGKHIASVTLFAVLVIVFFSPSVLDGKTLRQMDNEKATGMGNSQMAPYEETAAKGEFSVWSDAMFSGMPYISGYGDAKPKLPGFTWLERPLKSIDYGTASMVFTGLICFYILMYALGMSWWLAIAGSIAFAFASYNIIIIEAGHITKAYVIAYMPLTLAGMALLFKRNYLWGAVLFLLGIAFSINNGHIQITYYLFLLCLFIYGGYVMQIIKNRQYRDCGKTTAIMAICVILAILPNTKRLYADWDLGQHSTRGGSELTAPKTTGEKKSDGLDRDYAFQWSYGKKELLTLLIPNAYGGPSIGTLDGDSQVIHEYRHMTGKPIDELQAWVYWGDKPSTSGPVYFGAVVCFLFIFGMFAVKSSYKWWLFAGAMFITLLALGRNLAWFNDFIFHYLPLYNKFRAVEMALVIPGLVCPIIAIWGLKMLFEQQVNKNTFKKGFITALSLTGGICIVIWLVPSAILEFSSEIDNRQNLPEWFINALRIDRASMASADALRSLIFILPGAALIFWYWKTKNKKRTALYAAIGITVLTGIDLWNVDRRYINESKFIREKPHETYKISIADKSILEDTTSFRVLNPNNDPFKETNTSYFHHSIGGYHAAKLGRYQELIDHRLWKEIYLLGTSFKQAQSMEDIHEAFLHIPSLNMLNTKYIIYNPDQPPLLNPYAYGNAWFVPSYKIAANADEEMSILQTLEPKQEAVVDKRFETELQGFTPRYDPTATIKLTSYRPNRLIYHSSTSSEQLAVFSEIYYQPGWKAYIDGVSAPHFRVNWILRAMRIPAGQHEIVFEFYPDMYVKAAYIESYSSLIILLLVLGAIGYKIGKYILPLHHENIQT